MGERYLEVAVDAPTHHSRTYTYAAPDRLDLHPGHLVWVPIAGRLGQGIVFGPAADLPAAPVKPIADTVDPHPLLFPWQLDLARWIAEQYRCSLFTAAALMLPPGAERRARTFVRKLKAPDGAEPHLTAHQRIVLDLLGQREQLSLEEAGRALRKGSAAVVVEQLVRKGLVERFDVLEPPRVRPKRVRYLRLGGTFEELVARLDGLGRRNAEALQRALEVLRDRGPLPPAELARLAEVPVARLRVLQSTGLVETFEQEVRRDPIARRLDARSRLPEGIRPAPEPTPAQAAVLAPIREALSAEPPGGEVFLVHGVTGSGKTEIYLRALAQALAQGGRGIVLVPEIALTPQTIDRLTARFPGRVAVLHSRLSPGEQFDEWRRIRSGEVDVVLGSRSAIFAPVPQLRLIVVDEEHEWTYKQQEIAPRYDARDVARRIAELTGATLVLGSATPRLESYYRALDNSDRLLDLPERVGAAPLPPVEIVDLREELRAGNRSIFSLPLVDAITAVLAAREQVILFINRRGIASIVLCRDCGYVARCRRCDTPLAYHGPEINLVCHLCNQRSLVPWVCPTCWSRKIRFLGAGTQRVEAEVQRLFPAAQVLRWDRDATRTKHSHEEILDRFASGEANVLIGTQMIAKGLDLPLVTLVGVVSADVGLHLPDIRAGERVFQILTQVAGRAGRGQQPGRVIVQSYTPQHPAIVAASRHDYRRFYEQEIAFRQRHGYPPFSRLVRLVFSHTNLQAAQLEAEKLYGRLRLSLGRLGLNGRVKVIGPAPAYVGRLRGRFRWQIILRGRDLDPLLAELSPGRGWVLDVDPVSLL